MVRNLAKGILPDHEIVALANAGAIGVPAFGSGQVQPASLDLRLGSVAYRIGASFLPGSGSGNGATGCAVTDRLAELCLYPVDLSKGAVLERGCIYLVPAMETLALPEDIEAEISPKSSSGRLDVLVRTISGESSLFDTVPAGYHGRIFIEIMPQTFPIRVRQGSRLCQIRFRRRSCDGSTGTLAARNDSEAISGGRTETIGVDLSSRHGQPVAWRAKRNCGIVDVDQENALDPLDFWDPVWPGSSVAGGRLVLDPSEFYILASRETVSIPPDEVAEMVAFDPRLGEFRVHYAGFFDPGFGFAQAGKSGSRAVLEVRARDIPFMIEHGQPIGRLVYEKMASAPDSLYGRPGSHYQGQGLRLSKHFRSPSPFTAERAADLTIRMEQGR